MSTEFRTKRDMAIGYAAAGWPVFPCKADKSPYIEAWQTKASTDANQVDEWWHLHPDANIGFMPGDLNFMVVDLDPGADMDELKQSIGGLPETHLRAKTPRGEHYYYLLDEGEHVGPSAGKLAPHVDVRSSNSYVLLPGSTTEHGAYEWVEEGNPAYRTDEMVAKAGKRREKTANDGAPAIQGDLPENLAMAVTWLQSIARPAVEGQGGDHATFAASAMMHSYGIEESTALELMWNHYNPRCKPEWDYDDIAVKVTNAYSYAENPFGNATPAYKLAKASELFTAVQADLGDGGILWEGGGFRTVNREALEKIKPAEWLIADMIPNEGYVMMFAPWGSYKTFFALDLALSVACGDDTINPTHDGVKQGDVVYVAGEGRSNLVKRVKAWESKHLVEGGRAERFYLADPVPNVQGDGVDQFIALIKETGAEPKLVVLDTVARAMQGVNENAMENATLLTRMVERMQRELGCAVLAVHHTGHEAGDRPRGSSAFGGDVDVLLRLQAVESDDPDERFAKLELQKTKDGEPWAFPRFIQFDKVDVLESSSLVAMPATKEDLPKRTTQRTLDRARIEKIIDQKAVHYLTEAPGKTWSTRKLAERIAFDADVELADETVRKYLTELANNVESECRKWYEPDARQWIGRVIKTG